MVTLICDLKQTFANFTIAKLVKLIIASSFESLTWMIELCWEFLSVGCIWLYAIITSRMSFRVNSHSLSECQGTPCSKQGPYLKFKWQIRSHNRLVRKRKLNHLAKLAKWMSCVVSTYLYGAFYCMLLSCHVGLPEWIYALWFSWMLRNSLLDAGAISED